MRNPAPKEPSRQQRRHAARIQEFERLRKQFGGFSGSSHWWPVEMPRKVARQIAIDHARANA